jgi:uncharacterized membrane-anchored protein
MPILAVAQTPQSKSIADIAWQELPGTAKLGSIAQVVLPEGYRFADGRGARQFMELMENPTSGRELGVVLPSTSQSSWFMMFEFNPIGFVKDDEKNNLDADALLDNFKKANARGNAERTKRGWATLEIVGWQQPPFYDPATNNLRWALLATSEGDQVVNYSTRLLGRGGVMDVDLVLDPSDLATVLPEFDRLLKGFTFTTGHKYAEFRSGDKVAAYGLTALIAGGVGAAAAKSGLLAKFWKLIVLGFVVAATAIGKFVRALFGRHPQSDGSQGVN